MPPAFTSRVIGRDNGEVEREMREDVPYRADAIGPWLASAPVVARERRHSPKQAPAGPPHQPDMAIALDPVSDTIFVRTRPPRFRRWKSIGRSTCKGGAFRPQRTFAATR